jgi:hypothetical protein
MLRLIREVLESVLEASKTTVETNKAVVRHLAEVQEIHSQDFLLTMNNQVALYTAWASLAKNEDDALYWNMCREELKTFALRLGYTVKEIPYPVKKENVK